MTNHTEWNYAKEDLIRAVTALGLPERSSLYEKTRI